MSDQSNENTHWGDSVQELKTFTNIKNTNGKSKNNQYTKIFIGNIPWVFIEQDLEEVFNKYGKIIQSKIIQDNNTGRSRGFGFITFENKDSANASLEMHNSTFEGRNIRVELVDENHKKERYPKRTNVMI